MAKKDEKLEHEAHIDIPEIKERGSLFTDIVKIVAGLAVLVLGSRLLVEHSVIIAKALGVSEAIIGLTIIAAGTSMPELATSVVAAFRKQSDIALGNVLGSNLFNLMFVLGGSAAIHPVETSGLKPVDLWAMIGLTVILLPMLWTGKRLNRGEGLVLVACYGAYLAFMWPK
jgi:cation:H+ antiporter